MNAPLEVCRMAVHLMSTFEISGLTAPALAILKTAVLYAKENRQVKKHTMSLNTFCHLAGFPSLLPGRFWPLSREASGVLGIVEEVDTSAPDRGDLAYSSWPVFASICIDGYNVKFEICNLTFDDVLLAKLQNLRPVLPEA